MAREGSKSFSFEIPTESRSRSSSLETPTESESSEGEGRYLEANSVEIADLRRRAEDLAEDPKGENTVISVPAKEDGASGFKEFFIRSGRRAKKVGAGTIYVGGGILVAMTYLGYQTSRPAAYTASRALDWIGRKMDRLADKMIDKNFPVLKYLINPVVSLVGALSKRIDLDKTLVEHLKKKKEDRKKLAKKLFEDYARAQAAYETKEDQTKKREKRRVTLRGVLGDDVADALGDEFAELERDEEKSETEKTPAPPSAPSALSVESKAA